MRKVVGLVAVLVAGCSQSPAERASVPIVVAAVDASAPVVVAEAGPRSSRVFDVRSIGRTFDLRVEGDEVSFCDERGARTLDVVTGTDAPAGRSCRDEEGNTTCSNPSVEVEVSTPGLGPVDRVYVHAKFYMLEGRVHDCAVANGVLLLVTGANVIAIDSVTDRLDVIATRGGSRAALGARWIAWSDAAGVHARPRAAP